MCRKELKEYKSLFLIKCPSIKIDINLSSTIFNFIPRFSLTLRGGERVSRSNRESNLNEVNEEIDNIYEYNNLEEANNENINDS